MRNAGNYMLLAATALLVDRISKWWAMDAWLHEWVIAPFLSFQLTINRGISWGILHSADAGVYLLMTLAIMTITTVLGIYAFGRLKAGYSVIGEVLIISGSFSNIIDRCLYGGVIDFIMVHKGSLVWPLFNVADMCIVIGVMIMAWSLFAVREHA